MSTTDYKPMTETERVADAAIEAAYTADDWREFRAGFMSSFTIGLTAARVSLASKSIAPFEAPQVSANASASFQRGESRGWGDGYQCGLMLAPIPLGAAHFSPGMLGLPFGSFNPAFPTPSETQKAASEHARRDLPAGGAGMQARGRQVDEVSTARRRGQAPVGVRAPAPQ